MGAPDAAQSADDVRHTMREDRHGQQYCGWCYDHDSESQFLGPPQPVTWWPCPFVQHSLDGSGGTDEG